MQTELETKQSNFELACIYTFLRLQHLWALQQEIVFLIPNLCAASCFKPLFRLLEWLRRFSLKRQMTFQTTSARMCQTAVWNKRWNKLMIQGHAAVKSNMVSIRCTLRLHKRLRNGEPLFRTILCLLLQLFWCQSSAVHPAVLFSSAMQGCNFHFNFREEDVYWELLKLLRL